MGIGKQMQYHLSVIDRSAIEWVTFGRSHECTPSIAHPEDSRQIVFGLGKAQA